MNREVFFNEVRGDVFGGAMKQGQVDGLNAILSAWRESGLSDIRFLAYILATTFHETARTMQPIKEYGGRDYFVRMYDKTGRRPRVARVLGNTEVGDGARFCGRGYVQLTGRANYAKASKKFGVDFVRDPGAVMRPDHAARIMYAGMTEGWFTGKKLSNYFSEAKDDPRNARRIINGMDKASKIAGYHNEFLDALEQAAEAALPFEANDVAPQLPTDGLKPPAPDPPKLREPAKSKTKPAPEAGFFWGAFIRRILKWLAS